MFKFLSQFLYLLKDKKKLLALIIVLFLLVSVLEALGTGLLASFVGLATDSSLILRTPWLNQIYTTFNFNSPSQFTLYSGFLIVLISYFKAFLSFNAQKYIFNFSFKQQGELSSKLIHLYLKAPYSFHLNISSAAVIENIIQDTSVFTQGILIPFLNSISNGVIIIALLSLLIVTNASVTILITIALLACFIVFRRLKNRLSKWGKNGSDARTEMIRIINHSLGGLKEIRMIGCETYFEKQLKEQATKFAENTTLALSFYNLPRYAIEALLVTFIVFLASMSFLLTPNNSQNLVSVLGVFGLASIRLLPALGSLFSSTSSIRASSYAMDKLFAEFKEFEKSNNSVFLHTSNNFADLDNEITNCTQAISFKNLIKLEQLVYCYPNTSTNALTDIVLEIKKGKSIGLIGKSGSGKTTLVNVILGLLMPKSGDVLIDGVSIYTNLRGWQNLIGYVPQSIFLTDDTLARNIAFGVPDDLINHSQLYKAILAAQLSELIDQLPDGIHTKVGERGVLLSGGQRQRIGIARCIYHEREILVFDEATSALDHETEKLVTEAIKNLSGKKTMIIIAHRLSTLEHCNQIYVMKKGQIIKSGTYQEIVLGNHILPTSESDYSNPI